MDASIIIPTYKKEFQLSLVLGSIFNQNYPEKYYELIIVAKDPTDGLLQTVNSFKNKISIILIIQKGTGRANARNAGIRRAKGEIIIFTDDDLLLKDDFISQHAKSHNRKNAVILGKVFQLYLSNLDKMKEEDIFTKIDNIAREDPYFGLVRKSFTFKKNNVPWIGFGTNNSSLLKEDLTKISLFDNRFQGWGQDNIELGYRLFKKGVQFHYNPDACNYHLAHKREKTEIFKDIRQNLDYFCTKHNDLAVRLYKDFIFGEISLECFNKSAGQDSDLRKIKTDNGRLFYRHFQILKDWIAGGG